MERSEWLKAVYEAACRVAERHGPGLRKAIESKDDTGELRNEVQQVAAETIAAGGELWPFIVYSGHPEPSGADWRGAPSFEGAVVRVATAALAADIQDILENLSTGRALGLRTEKAPETADPLATTGPGVPRAGGSPDSPAMPPVPDVPDAAQPKIRRGRRTRWPDGAKG